MKNKISETFKTILAVLGLLGVVGLVAFDYLSDGCIASMSGEGVCGDDAREDLYEMIVIFGVCCAVMLIRRYRKIRKVGTDV